MKFSQKVSLELKKHTKQEIQDALIQDFSLLDRPIPYDKEAEEGLLSCLFQNPDEYIPICIQRVKKGMIFHEQNENIYNAFIKLYELGIETENNVIALTHYLREEGILDSVGGAAHISELHSFVPIPSHFRHFISVLERKFKLRQVIAKCAYGIYLAQDISTNELDADKFVSLVEDEILSINENSNNDFQKINTPAMEAVEDLQKAIDNPGALTGLSTGFKQLDFLTGGLKGGDLFVIAARPSQGKTSLVMNIVEYAGLIEEKTVAVFSLEVQAKLLTKALMCRMAGLSMHDVSSGILTRSHMEYLSIAIAKIQKSNIYIDDTSSIDIKVIRSKSRRLKKKHGLDLIVIDYLQLATCEGEGNREREISKISSGLKALAKELDIPIIVLAQLNRAVENRKESRPVLSDLRESGSIEQDADIVGLLTRSGYFGNKQKKEENEVIDEREAKLIIAKNRNGPTDDVELLFNKELTRFTEHN